ncbi:low molecular weight protein-tyrosine-phosphatase [Erythrobacter sp. MTPC3]|uniref:low molecular weight protein-tyrosine-phosphatase n=1 Tax=Erythrobacter sp. MTPC3 TaxID=3056564 RepID=UPI0036F3555B
MLGNDDKRTGVLFVCLGNICRSPMAEGAFRSAAARAGLDCVTDSVGTAAYHLGEAPDDRAIATAAAHDVDISGLRGRQLEAEDFRRFNHIFALDTANLFAIKAKAPLDGIAKVALLMDLVKGREGTAVKDPYYGDMKGFETAWKDVSVAADALVKMIARKIPAAND